MLFFSFRYSAASPLFSAAIIASSDSAKLPKVEINSPSDFLASSVSFGIFLNASIFFFASAISSCTMREFSAAPAASPLARWAAAMSARMVARSICVYTS